MNVRFKFWAFEVLFWLARCGLECLFRAVGVATFVLGFARGCFFRVVCVSMFLQGLCGLKCLFRAAWVFNVCSVSCGFEPKARNPKP